MTDQVKKKRVYKPRPKKPPQGTPRGPGGRPSLLSDEVQRELASNRSLGLSMKRSCELAGVSYDVYNNWFNIGKTNANVPAGKRTAHQQKCVDFYHLMGRVDSEWLKRCEVVLNLALTPGQNQKTWEDASVEDRRIAVDVAKFKATHLASAEYTTKTQTELTGADGGPLKVSGKVALEILRELEDEDDVS